MSIGRNLRLQRKKAGISQKQLAEMAHLSVATIQCFEQEKCTKAKFETVEKLASALKVQPWDIDEKYQVHSENDNVTDEYLLSIFHELNAKGKGKITSYASDLLGNPYYQEEMKDKNSQTETVVLEMS